MRENERNDMDAPRFKKSKTERLDPNLAIPNKDKEDPKRAKDLRDTDAPMCA